MRVDWKWERTEILDGWRREQILVSFGNKLSVSHSGVLSTTHLPKDTFLLSQLRSRDMPQELVTADEVRGSYSLSCCRVVGSLA